MSTNAAMKGSLNKKFSSKFVIMPGRSFTSVITGRTFRAISMYSQPSPFGNQVETYAILNDGTEIKIDVIIDMLRDKLIE